MIKSLQATLLYVLARWVLADADYMRRRYGNWIIRRARWHGIPKRKHWWRSNHG